MAASIFKQEVTSAKGSKEGDPDLQCIVCEEEYSDDSPPRNLGCGHTLCTTCLSQYFSKNHQKSCPECRRPFHAKSASDLTINYPLLRLARSLSTASSTSKGSQETKLRWDNRVIIEDSDFGPVWKPSPFDYMCEITSPKKQTEFFGMKNYIAYTVTPSFSAKHVLRRYKQFDFIQEKLKSLFPLIILPKLPEKQILGKFNDEVVEYRQQVLQTWIDYICCHPILSQSDIFRLFITVSNEVSWEAAAKKMKTESHVHRSFFSGVQTPKSDFDLQEVDTKLESYAVFVRELKNSVKELQSASLTQFNNWQMEYMQDKEQISQALLKLAQTFSTASCEDPELPLLVFRVSEAYSSLATLPKEEVQAAWQSLYKVASEYSVLIDELDKILTVARKNVAQAYRLEMADYEDARASSYVFLAEVAHLKSSFIRDIKKVIKVVFQNQYEFYQSITDHLRSKLEEIMSDGTGVPSAPPLDLWE
ncbi:sorting nexin-9-like [Macrobrachium nipponense]|uniref:sorting nexin-9-like n=1 Tax=Macrobrachium nipponense TaxID=159736 RepID=UPI0030C80536